eukprot:1878464-Rhodomonas_salina.4
MRRPELTSHALSAPPDPQPQSQPPLGPSVCGHGCAFQPLHLASRAQPAGHCAVRALPLAGTVAHRPSRQRAAHIASAPRRERSQPERCCGGVSAVGGQGVAVWKVVVAGA